jgi:hypothetical protein
LNKPRGSRPSAPGSVRLGIVTASPCQTIRSSTISLRAGGCPHNTPGVIASVRFDTEQNQPGCAGIQNQVAEAAGNYRPPVHAGEPYAGPVPVLLAEVEVGNFWSSALTESSTTSFP